MYDIFRRLLPWLSGALVLVGVAVGVLYWQFAAWADEPLAIDEPFQFHLQVGQTLASTADQLASQNYLQDKRRFILLGRLTGADRRLQAGEYAVSVGTSPRQLLQQLTRGEVLTYDFRIEEGSTVADVLQALASEPTLRHEIQARDAQDLRDELPLSTPFAEGAFFPDTYQYRRGDSDRTLLMRAHQSMLELLDEAWQGRAQDGELQQPSDALILASIIEKETGREADRTQISQVFHLRLQKRMLLQTDPTVIYALGRAFDGNLTRPHLKIDSPFNTYRYRGLPPTPIALPSAASLHAAVHPAQGEFLYFVAKGDGASQFSQTLAEHNQAVRRYQLNLGGDS